jgi:hypothetical protein
MVTLLVLLFIVGAVICVRRCWLDTDEEEIQ